MPGSLLLLYDAGLFLCTQATSLSYYSDNVPADES